MMKMIALKCPECGAPLRVDAGSGRRFFFCEYCGRKIILDDGVRRTEHTENINITHRTVDVARLRDAEARMKEASIKEQQELARQRRRYEKNNRRKWIWLVIIGLIAVGFIRGRITAAISVNYKNQIAKQIMDICTEHAASIESIRIYSKTVDIDILIASSKKSDVDRLQEDILKGLKVEYGYKVSLSFEKPKYHTQRWVEINEYGSVNVITDNTGELSDEEAEALISVYEEGLTDLMDENNAELKKVTYQSDKICLQIRCKTYERAAMQSLVNAIEKKNRQLEKKALEVVIEDDSGHVFYKVDVSEAGRQKIQDDYSNDMTDEEMNSLIKEYTEALTSAVKAADARISDIRVRNDILKIDITVPYKDKESVGKLEQRISSAIEDLQKNKLEISITGSNSFMTIKEYTVDENGVVDVMLDFTKD